MYQDHIFENEELHRNCRWVAMCVSNRGHVFAMAVGRSHAEAKDKLNKAKSLKEKVVF